MNWESWLQQAGYDPAQGYRVTGEWVAESPVPILVPYPDDDWYETIAYCKDISGWQIVVDDEVRQLRVGAWPKDEIDAVIIPPTHDDVAAIKRLAAAVASLRAPGGCPWDRKQTHATLRRYLIEETYEVLDAIDRRDMKNLREELGDLLLQIVFHTQLASETGQFTLADVAADAATKMICRHPHVFDATRTNEAETVATDWEKRKQKEKKRKKILEGMIKSLPSLVFACRIQEKTARVGFDWESVGPAWEKVQEEWREVRAALNEGNPLQVEEECGDVLFATVNVLRHLGIEPESALRQANEKFCQRFAHVEARVQESGRDWDQVAPNELDTYWKEAKHLTMDR